MKFDDNVYAREKIIKETMEIDSGMKIKELKSEIIRLKDIHLKEKELIEKKAQANIESLKIGYEQVKLPFIQK